MSCQAAPPVFQLPDMPEANRPSLQIAMVSPFLHTPSVDSLTGDTPPLQKGDTSDMPTIKKVSKAVPTPTAVTPAAVVEPAPADEYPTAMDDAMPETEPASERPKNNKTLSALANKSSTPPRRDSNEAKRVRRSSSKPAGDSVSSVQGPAMADSLPQLKAATSKRKSADKTTSGKEQEVVTTESPIRGEENTEEMECRESETTTVTSSKKKGKKVERKEAATPVDEVSLSASSVKTSASVHSSSQLQSEGEAESLTAEMDTVDEQGLHNFRHILCRIIT